MRNATSPSSDSTMHSKQNETSLAKPPKGAEPVMSADRQQVVKDTRRFDLVMNINLLTSNGGHDVCDKSFCFCTSCTPTELPYWRAWYVHGPNANENSRTPRAP